MLTRFLNYLASQFKRQQTNVVNTVPISTHSKSKIQTYPPRNLLPKQNAQLHLAQQQINAEYKLVQKQGILPELTKEEKQKLEMHVDVLDQMNQLTEDFKKLRVSEEKIIERRQNISNEISFESIRRQRKQNNNVRRQFELKQQYQNEVKEYLQLKYTLEKTQYFEIPLEDFKIIRQYWNNRAKTHQQIKNTGFDCVKKLTYKAMGGIQFGEWLNDDVINIYIEMMEKTFIRDLPTPFRILNSYFATTTLQKAESQIQRLLRKRNLEKTNWLIMPINNRNHWYFAVFDNNSIIIHDSIRHEQKYYLDNPIFKNALKFARMFYEKDYELKVRIDYPQQDNSFDCGIFMLMGIRDILRKKEWSYHQGDIRFKRIQIAYEILQEKLIYSE